MKKVMHPVNISDNGCEHGYLRELDCRSCHGSLLCHR